MAIQIRESIPEDNEFITSLFARFSEFELPEWRQADEIDNANRVSSSKGIGTAPTGLCHFYR